MRAAGTWLIVAALAALGLAAVLDSLVPGSGPLPASANRAVTTGSTSPGEPVALTHRAPQIAARTTAALALADAGVAGYLYLSDARCRLTVLRLPSLRAVRAPPQRLCSFSVSPDGRFSAARTVWQPHGVLHAQCRKGSVFVRDRSGEPFLTFTACAPAWKPDGELTYARGTQVVRVPFGTRCTEAAGIATPGRAPACGRLVLSERTLSGALAAERRFAARHSSIRSLRPTDLVWLSETRLAALVETRTGPRDERHLVAIYERRRLVSASSLGQVAGPRDLRASPSGSYLVVQGDRRALVLDRAGRRVPLPIPLPYVRAVAWSPDERWAVVAGPASVYFIDLRERDRPPIRLPVLVRDLEWRDRLPPS